MALGEIHRGLLDALAVWLHVVDLSRVARTPLASRGGWWCKLPPCEIIDRESGITWGVANAHVRSQRDRRSSAAVRSESLGCWSAGLWLAQNELFN
ncbi:hypothetical protein C6341_g27404 [Phytophthora cactorum]|uniref:Uncharacterized protein n=1 Tax=Phytophthora cactorum TaxID=29920 RepID=A0A8T1ACK1_9STRA|nr:hypothetical protein PC117_g27418 [Phytophthora cactorum]KAG3119581.1 hypothetical protein C6341_g27404 [Phytophthora cactorum]